LFATKPNNNSPLCIYHPTSNTHSSEEFSLNPTNRSKTKKEETGRISSSNKSNNNQHSNTSQNSSNQHTQQLPSRKRNFGVACVTSPVNIAPNIVTKIQTEKSPNERSLHSNKNTPTPSEYQTCPTIIPSK